MLVVCGSDAESGPRSDVLAFDTASGAWSRVKTAGSEPEGREMHASVLLGGSQAQRPTIVVVAGRGHDRVLNDFYALDVGPCIAFLLSLGHIFDLTFCVVQRLHGGAGWASVRRAAGTCVRSGLRPLRLLLAATANPSGKATASRVPRLLPR